ncbi:MAG: lamin tail domain-containing protein, partial [Phycisphaerales bacterium]|nr:lamin tail domain-containing protein [Phycisphaerales bacterium]
MIISPDRPGRCRAAALVPPACIAILAATTTSPRLLGQTSPPESASPGHTDSPSGEDTTPDDDAPPDEAPPPAPVISEVLFAVPRTDADANRDGHRHSTGDEFVEIWNPTDEPVTLTGYTLASRLAAADPEPARGFHFTFPRFTLPPRGVAVIFNGFDWRPKGPVGTSGHAPRAPHPDFGGAWVFTAAISSPNHAFSNGG